MEQRYAQRVERRMKTLYARLSEKDRRRYAAVEADKLGAAGVEYVAQLFGVDPKTVRQGLADLDEEDDPAGERVRKKGADASASST